MDCGNEVLSTEQASSDTNTSAHSSSGAEISSAGSNPISESLGLDGSVVPSSSYQTSIGSFDVQSRIVSRGHAINAFSECMRRSVRVNIDRLTWKVLEELRVRGYHLLGGISSGSLPKRSRSESSSRVRDPPVKRARKRAAKPSSEVACDSRSYSRRRKCAEITKPSRSLMRSPLKLLKQIKVEPDDSPTIPDEHCFEEELVFGASALDRDPLRDDVLDSSFCHSPEGETVDDSGVFIDPSVKSTCCHSARLSQTTNHTDPPASVDLTAPSKDCRSLIRGSDLPNFPDSFEHTDDLAIDIASSSFFDSEHLTPSDFNAMVNDLLDSSENLVISSVYSLDESLSTFNAGVGSTPLDNADADPLMSHSKASDDYVPDNKVSPQQSTVQDFPIPEVCSQLVSASQGALHEHFDRGSSSCLPETPGNSVPGSADSKLEQASPAPPLHHPEAPGGEVDLQGHADQDLSACHSHTSSVLVPANVESVDPTVRNHWVCHSKDSSDMVSDDIGTQQGHSNQDPPACHSDVSSCKSVSKPDNITVNSNSSKTLGNSGAAASTLACPSLSNNSPSSDVGLVTSDAVNDSPSPAPPLSSTPPRELACTPGNVPLDDGSDDDRCSNPAVDISEDEFPADESGPAREQGYCLRQCRVVLHDVRHMDCLRGVFHRALAVWNLERKCADSSVDPKRRVFSTSPTDHKSHSEHKSNFLKNLLSTPSPHKVKKHDHHKTVEKHHTKDKTQLETPSSKISQILPKSEVSNFSVASFRIPKKADRKCRVRYHETADREQRSGVRRGAQNNRQDLPCTPGGHRGRGSRNWDSREDRVPGWRVPGSWRNDHDSRRGECYGLRYEGPEYSDRAHPPRRRGSWSQRMDTPPASRTSYLSGRGWVSNPKPERSKPLHCRQEKYTDASAIGTSLNKLASAGTCKAPPKWSVHPLIEGRQVEAVVMERPKVQEQKSDQRLVLVSPRHPLLSPEPQSHETARTPSPGAEHCSPERSPCQAGEPAESAADPALSDSPSLSVESGPSPAPGARVVVGCPSPSTPCVTAARAGGDGVPLATPSVSIRTLKLKALRQTGATSIGGGPSLACSTIADVLGLTARMKTCRTLSSADHNRAGGIILSPPPSRPEATPVSPSVTKGQITQSCSPGCVTLKSLKIKADMFSRSNQH